MKTLIANLVFLSACALLILPLTEASAAGPSIQSAPGLRGYSYTSPRFKTTMLSSRITISPASSNSLNIKIYNDANKLVASEPVDRVEVGPNEVITPRSKSSLHAEGIDSGNYKSVSVGGAPPKKDLEETHSHPHHEQCQQYMSYNQASPTDWTVRRYCPHGK